jgi:hypothetical protein
MLWVARSEKDTATDTFERRLWDAADRLRADSSLTSSQFLLQSSVLSCFASSFAAHVRTAIASWRRVGDELCFD